MRPRVYHGNDNSRSPIFGARTYYPVPTILAFLASPQKTTKPGAPGRCWLPSAPAANGGILKAAATRSWRLGPYLRPLTPQFVKAKDQINKRKEQRGQVADMWNLSSKLQAAPTLHPPRLSGGKGHVAARALKFCAPLLCTVDWRGGGGEASVEETGPKLLASPYRRKGTRRRRQQRRQTAESIMYMAGALRRRAPSRP